MCCLTGITQGHLGVFGELVWSAERSGGRPRGRHHGEGGVEARMPMAWVPGCKRHYVRRQMVSVNQSINQSINQNLFHINYNQVQHIHNNVERGK